MREESLLLHTVQDAVVVEALQEGGVWRPDPEHVYPEWREPYAWLYGQMADLLGTDIPGAVWLWARTTREALVDQCQMAARSDGESVLLTCRVPRSRLVISHFSDWHAVLNRSLHVAALRGESLESWEQRWEPLMDSFYERLDRAEGRDRSRMSTWPQQLREEVVASWSSILDLDLYFSESRQRKTWPEIWQATTPYLVVDEVIDAVRLV